MSHFDFGLSADVLEKIRKVLSRHKHVQRALVYGSRAKGNYQAGSDIDLTLEGESLTVNDLLAIDGELDDLLLAYKIDLSLLSKIEDPSLRDHILRMGRELYRCAEG